MRTSPTQFAMIVDFMERNGDLAKPSGGPRGRQWATNKWRELSTKLNSDGTGDSRSEEKWRKVWTDLKNNTKRKTAKLKRSMTGTGGGPALKISLTDLEHRVMAIMGEQAATGMTSISEVGFGHAEQELEVVLENDSNPKIPDEDPYLEKVTSPLHVIGDEDWNLPGTSQQQLPAPAPASEPSPAQTKKWTPAKKKRSEVELFLKAEKERDKMFYELEKERIRQRDNELELQNNWLAIMNEALNLFRNFIEGKNKTTD